MTIHNEKSPAPVAAGNEGNELGKCSVTTAYLTQQEELMIVTELLEEADRLLIEDAQHLLDNLSL